MDAGAAGGTVNGPSATNGVGWTAINWVKMTNAASGTGQFFFGRYNNGASQFQWFNYNVTSQIFTTIYGTCAGANATTISGPASANGTWYMVGFDTLGNGTNIDGDLCVNGVSGGTFTNKAVCANSGISTNISVADPLSNEYPLAGTIDEVATFPSRLACTTTQLALYNCGFNGTSCAGGAYNSNGLYMTGKLEDFGPQMPYPLTGGYKKIKAYADNPNSGPILPSIFHP
jgi:hypothetical protein